MTNVIKLPIPQNTPNRLPRKRVFYLGWRYVGPMLCQDIQHLYLKRKGMINGTRWWGMITYGRYDDCDPREYSLELEECEEEAVPDLLRMFEMESEVSFADLRSMGWRGHHDYRAEVIDLSNIQTLGGGSERS